MRTIAARASKLNYDSFDVRQDLSDESWGAERAERKEDEQHSVDGIVERVPSRPRALELLPGLDTLPYHIEVEDQPRKITVRQVGEQLVPKRIVLLK